MVSYIAVPVWKGQMKTTVEISDSLLREVRRLAAREGVTLRTLVERGLHRVVAETKHGPPFKLRRASFKGKGQQAGLRNASWDRLRELTYEGRGT
jgi:hypothetical protein